MERGRGALDEKARGLRRLLRFWCLKRYVQIPFSPCRGHASATRRERVPTPIGRPGGREGEEIRVLRALQPAHLGVRSPPHGQGSAPGLMGTARVPRCVDCGRLMFSARKNRKRCNACRYKFYQAGKAANKRKRARERRIALDKLYWGPKP